jgi:hypothetical protein
LPGGLDAEVDYGPFLKREKTSLIGMSRGSGVRIPVIVNRQGTQTLNTPARDVFFLKGFVANFNCYAAVYKVHRSLRNFCSLLV